MARSPARKEYERRWREANREKIRARERKRRLQRTEYQRVYQREYQRRLAGLPAPTHAPSEWCESCGRAFEGAPHLDHDHVTGKFRGWICGACNRGIGLLGDCAEGVAKALAYLRRAQ